MTIRTFRFLNMTVARVVAVSPQMRLVQVFDTN